MIIINVVDQHTNFFSSFNAQSWWLLTYLLSDFHHAACGNGNRNCNFLLCQWHLTEMGGKGVDKEAEKDKAEEWKGRLNRMRSLKTNSIVSKLPIAIHCTAIKFHVFCVVKQFGFNRIHVVQLFRSIASTNCRWVWYCHFILPNLIVILRYWQNTRFSTKRTCFEFNWSHREIAVIYIWGVMTKHQWNSYHIV